MKPKIILLVEDNPSDIGLTKRALAKSRIANELVVAEDGQAALDYLFGNGPYAGRDMNELPALILLDLNLPRVDGLEALRQVRADPRTSRLPVVILTTSKEEQDVARSYDLGANSYIRKPVDFTQFAKAVEHLGLYWLVLNEPAPPKASSMAKPLAVLIVEDSESDTQLIVRLLKKAGYEITFGQVESAAQMRAALQKQAWEIVVSDYSLPEFDGHAALMLLQETGLDIPFIVVSGTMGEETAVDMMKAGAHDYVMKGNLARLVPAVERELIQAEVRRERRRAEEALRESEERYRQIIETAQEGIWTVDTAGRTTLVNQRMADMLGYTVEEMLGKPADAFLDKEEIAIAPVDFGGRRQENKQFDFKFKRKDGSAIWALVEASALLDRNHHYMGALSMLTDITGRKQAEEKLRETNEILQALVQASPVSIVALDLDGNVKKWNPASERIFGWSEAEVLGRFLPYIPQDKLDENEALRRQALGGKSFTNLEVDRLKKDGSPILISLSCVPLHDGSGRVTGVMGVNIDITERKRAEEALRESEAKFRSYIEHAPLGVFIVDRLGRYVEVNAAAAEMLGYTQAEILHLSIPDVLAPQSLEAGLGQFQSVVQDGFSASEFLLRRKDGAQFWATVDAVKLSEDRFMSYCQDITGRKQAEEEIRRRLSELEVLYQSGLAFSQLIDQKAIAEKVIDLLDQNMDWHHTAIRLYHPESETLELLAFHLPQFNSLEQRSAEEERFKTMQRPDQGLSGWVLQHGQVVCSSDLKNDPRYFETFPGLQSGLYVPIKIAERVIGVISIESERPQAFSESDERLAITLAAQAAIAMDNAQLFESLKCSNVELAAAYDATIEGWSRALDLRDKETEGHSLRVTDMTLRLAQSMGFSQEEVVYVRWGALLHDIGKLGVPDVILFKPGPLTDEEWLVMKKHPALAYEMLSPVHYLQRALDIPYCHHEKWDGSGYPRGLKETQIPLGARIFAIVDVWDALSSDRPYRARWTKEKVDEHIRLSSGAHFDPQVVDAFMRMPH